MTSSNLFLFFIEIGFIVIQIPLQLVSEDSVYIKLNSFKTFGNKLQWNLNKDASVFSREKGIWKFDTQNGSHFGKALMHWDT